MIRHHLHRHQRRDMDLIGWEHERTFYYMFMIIPIAGGVICFWGAVWALGAIFMAVLMAKNYCVDGKAATEAE